MKPPGAAKNEFRFTVPVDVIGAGCDIAKHACFPRQLVQGSHSLQELEMETEIVTMHRIKAYAARS